MEVHRADVLVIGSGVAGLRAALAAAEQGVDVLVVSASRLGRGGSSAIASAGIAAALTDEECDDFYNDILAAGWHINDRALVRTLVDESGRRFRELEGYGVQFIKTNGGYQVRKAPGHKRPRSYRAVQGPWPYNGLSMTCTLADALQSRPRSRIFEKTRVVRLVKAGDRVVGAVAVDTQGQLLALLAARTVLAAGGGAALWARTNGTSDVDGAAIGMALAAGAWLRDMEFAQFHPLRAMEPVDRFVSDSLMEDGARLRNRHGELFAARYHPDAEHAPRDVRARAIYSEIKAGRGVAGGVYLDFSAIPRDRMETRQPLLLRLLESKGLDLSKDYIVVSPAAHYVMGGLYTDTRCRTPVPGLLAAGECMGGVQGANRLGSVGFTEAVVFGAIAGEQAARESREDPLPAAVLQSPRACLDEALEGLGQGAPRRGGHGPAMDRSGPSEGDGSAMDRSSPDGLEGPAGPADARALWNAIRRVLWSEAALERTGEGLARGWRQLQGIARAARELPAGTAREWADRAGVLHCVAMAEAVLLCSARRQESRGAHYRSDYPDLKPELEGSFFVRRRGDGYELAFVPVGDRVHDAVFQAAAAKEVRT